MHSKCWLWRWQLPFDSVFTSWALVVVPAYRLVMSLDVLEEVLMVFTGHMHSCIEGGDTVSVGSRSQ